MMIHVRFFSLLVLFHVQILVFAASSSAFTMSLNENGISSLTSLASDNSVPADVDAVNPTTLPYSFIPSTVDGTSSADSNFNLSNTLFDSSFDHSAGAYDNTLYSVTKIFFSVDQDLNYAASGSYSAVDSAGSEVKLVARLYDETDNYWVFRSEQESRSTPNETFTLGEVGGDDVNIDLGSLTGDLLAGHYYRYYSMGRLDTDELASSATASGNLSFSLSAIPEPSTALLLILGLVGLATTRRTG